MKFFAFCFALCCAFCAAAADIDFNAYGAGPMLKPAGTFYVTPAGNDKNDGKSLKTAWRSISRGVKDLRAGDTLLIAGGIYNEGQISLNVADKKPHYKVQWGKPGAPIRIMGMPNEKVIIQGGKFFPFNGKGRVHTFKKVPAPVYNIVWEAPSQIEFQSVDFPEIVKEIPGTYFYDVKKKELTVHFVCNDPQGIRVAVERVAIRLRGSFLHLENVIFQNFHDAVSVRANAPKKQNEVKNVTVKNCGVFYCSNTGFDVEDGHHGLFINNFGQNNGHRGSFVIQPGASDNLFTGNRFGASPWTLRHQLPYNYNYAFNFYGFNPGKRNHVISNIFDDVFAFRWKSACPESIFRNNIVLGKFRVESGNVPVLVENNLITGQWEWTGVSLNASDKSFTNTPMKFRNNLKKTEDFKYTDPRLEEAKKLVLPPLKYTLPKVEFKNLRADFICNDSAAVFWETPDNDGTGEVICKNVKEKKVLRFKTLRQGVRHTAGLTGLKPDTEYLCTAYFYGRRGEKARSASFTFRTAKSIRAPKVLEVGQGKMTLEEASCAALPGDTVKLLPGRHVGSFAPLRSGTPGKPIILQGNGNLIDGLNFYSPLVQLNDRRHIIIDNVRFANTEYDSRKGVISALNARNITVKNCISIHKLYAGPFFKASGARFDLENNVSCGGDYALSFRNAQDVRLHRNSILNSGLFSLIFWGGAGNYSITDNIFYRSAVPQKTNPAMLFIGITGKIHSEGNVFWSPLKHQYIGGEFSTLDRKRLSISKTLKEWQQQTGMDKTSLHADPRFVNIEKGDFRLKPGSPAAGKGALVK